MLAGFKWIIAGMVLMVTAFADVMLERSQSPEERLKEARKKIETMRAQIDKDMASAGLPPFIRNDREAIRSYWQAVIGDWTEWDNAKEDKSDE